jgi:hypothetical protein
MVGRRAPPLPTWAEAQCCTLPRVIAVRLGTGRAEELGLAVAPPLDSQLASWTNPPSCPCLTAHPVYVLNHRVPFVVNRDER